LKPSSCRILKLASWTARDSLSRITVTRANEVDIVIESGAKNRRPRSEAGATVTVADFNGLRSAEASGKRFASAWSSTTETSGAFWAESLCRANLIALGLSLPENARDQALKVPSLTSKRLVAQSTPGRGSRRRVSLLRTCAAGYGACRCQGVKTSQVGSIQNQHFERLFTSRAPSGCTDAMNRLEVSLQQAIQALHARGWSQRRIARELNIDRDRGRSRAAPKRPFRPPGRRRRRQQTQPFRPSVRGGSRTKTGHIDHARSRRSVCAGSSCRHHGGVTAAVGQTHPSRFVTITVHRSYQSVKRCVRALASDSLAAPRWSAPRRRDAVDFAKVRR